MKSRVVAIVLGAVIALQPMTVLAQESEDVVIAVEETVDSEEVSSDVEEAVETEEVADETAVSTPAFDKKALKLLNEAAEFESTLKINSFKGGLAACNQVDRCRKLATKLLVYKLSYEDGQTVIGTAYDMAHGNNNYILLHMIDPSTGEDYVKYYDFYMQDANGNNIDNAFLYHTVDRITIVEKGTHIGDKKIGMYQYPTFASKSNGTVIYDYNTYSQLISEDFRAYVESTLN